MQESPVYQSIIQRGKEQGITLGEARGARQTSIETTVNILGVRFPNADINALKRQLEAIDDLDRLKQLNLFVYTAKSLHDFQQSPKRSIVPPKTEFSPLETEFFPQNSVS